MYRSKRGKTHKSLGGGGGGGNCVGAFVCVRGMLSRGIFFNARLIVMVAIECGVICYLKGFLHFTFGILKFSTTREWNTYNGLPIICICAMYDYTSVK